MNQYKTLLLSILWMLPWALWSQSIDTPRFSTPVKMGLEVNSNAEELMPLLSPDGNTLYFARFLHEQNTGGKKSGHDIWVSRKNGMDWGQANNYATLNTTLGDAVVGIGASNRKLYLLNDNSKNEPGLGTVLIQGTGPSTKVVQDRIYFRKNMQEVYGAYVHPSGEFLLISARHDSMRWGYDLMIYKKNGTSWRRMSLSGVNSQYDEMSPFLSHDTLLYFASNRPNGQGGFDIYCSHPTNEYMTSWSKPVNLGPAVNSPGFDAYFSTHPNGSAFLVSNREGKLSDVYSCTKLKPEPTQKVDEVSAADSSGPVVSVEAQNMQDYLKTEKRTPPEYIYFASNSVELSDSAKQVLDLLLEVIETDPSVHIELRGYSDNLGSAVYNLKLSRLRSEAAMEYLVGHGVREKKIATVGNGIATPLANNKTAEGRAKNRRVQLILYKK